MPQYTALRNDDSIVFQAENYADAVRILAERGCGDYEIFDEQPPRIGICFKCGCGNRPGPWHDVGCSAYMETEEFTHTGNDNNETQSTTQ